MILGLLLGFNRGTGGGDTPGGADNVILLSGDMTDGDDILILSGDMQSGGDALVLSGSF